jgi:hypothetical protein
MLADNFQRAMKWVFYNTGEDAGACHLHDDSSKMNKKDHISGRIRA